LGVFVLVRTQLASQSRLEDKRLELEREKTVTMREGFTSINGKLDTHHTLDIQSHAEIAANIASMRGEVAGAMWREQPTPVGGGPYQDPRPTPRPASTYSYGPKARGKTEPPER
jgi:hypothetical protein